MPKLRFDPQGLSWKLAQHPGRCGPGHRRPAGAARRRRLAGPWRDGVGGHEPAHTGPRWRRLRPNDSKGDHSGHGSAAKDAHLVAGVSYSFALPAGWERVDPPSGATYAAQAKDGGADATLWITEDPKLDFPTFVSQSLSQLEALAGSAQVVDRVPAPTAEDTIVRLAADAPEGQPSYEVTLRVAGPYRYYLATSVEPDASKKASDGADLIAGSFTPDLGG